jgi:transketolase
MRILGVPDSFAPTGTAEYLLDYFGISAAGIERAALELVGTESK